MLARLDKNTGNALWTKSFPSGSCQPAAAFAIAVGSDDHLYSAGYTQPTNAGKQIMHLARLDGNTGATYWQTLVPSLETGPGRAVLHDVTVDAAATRLFAVGNESGTSGASPNYLWSRTLSVSTANGKLAEIPDDAIFLIPIWDNWLLWLVPVDDIEQVEQQQQRLLEQGVDYAYLTTHSLEILERQPDTPLNVFADTEGELVRQLAGSAERFGSRTAAAILYVQQGSPADALASELLDPQALEAAAP
jgi:outer membrane protein assembly factor BamB